MVEVDEGERDQSRGEDEIRRQHPRVVKARTNGRPQQRVEQFDQRVARGDRGAPVPALAAQQQPREDGDVVARRDRRVAARAVRGR